MALSVVERRLHAGSGGARRGVGDGGRRRTRDVETNGPVPQQAEGPPVSQDDPQLGRRRSGARAELVDRAPVDRIRSRNSSLASTPATWVFRYHIVLDA